MTKSCRSDHEEGQASDAETVDSRPLSHNGGRIALRTEESWDANIEADCVRQDGSVSEFQVRTQRPYFYFKLMPPLASPLGAPHRFRVFLPPGYYENTLKKYPVLYMHDGPNLFFKEEAFVGNTWRTDEVLNMLDKINAIEAVIVVGIHPNDRMKEYTLLGYEDYDRFLVEKLKPLIDAKYRTLSGATNAAVMGSSLRGVVSFCLGWQWPEVFGKVACLSSTFTYRDDLLERVSMEPKRKIRIYLDSGWPGDNYEATRSMRDRLIWKRYRLGSELFYLAFPEAKHEENAWAARSPIPFQFLFGKLPAFG
jgi:predicted alpha/beta superfamily hydrolase